MNTTKSSEQVLISLLTAFVIFLVTFPKIVPDYGTGLDPSYVWAVNFLFVNNYDSLTNLVYPIGPFGFLKYTAAFEQNLLYGIAFFSIVKLLFLYLLIRLSIASKGRFTVVSFFIVLLVATFSGIDFSIVGSTVILLLFSLIKPGKKWFFILANLFALFGLCIKSSIGIAAYSSIFTYLVYLIFSKEPNLKKIGIFSSVSVLVFLLGGTLIFQGVPSFFNFLLGLIHLAGGYSSALALFPDNNWWLLSGFVFSVLAFPVFVKKRDTRSAFLILFLPLFAMWKHAMGREDISHIYVLFTFLFAFWGIIFLFVEKLRLWYVVFPVLSIVFFDANIRHVNLHRPFNPNLHGVTNFTEAVINYTNFNEKYKTISKKNIRKNQFDNEIKELIGNESVDVYPWDLSYVPANGLNWKPRTTLELGAANSQWLSQKNANCFEEDSGPEFVILHLNNGKWGGSLGSLDGRYLLNDEPLVVFNFLENYKIALKNKRFLLLQKSKSSLNKTTLKTEIANWDSWVKVPEKENLTRVRVKIHKSFLLKLKSFFYKDEAFFVDYQLEDARVLTYRFIASTAVDGLWIDPLVLNPESVYPEAEVTQVRFRSSNSDLMDSRIDLEWESIDLPVNTYFLKSDSISKNYLVNFYEDYESATSEKLLLTGATKYSGRFSEKIPPGSFSATTRISLDTLWKDSVEDAKVEARVRFKNISSSAGALLVMTVEGSEDDFWKSFPLLGNENSEDWSKAFISKLLTKKDHQKGVLSIYVWNNSKDEIFIDDFSIMIW